MLHAISATLGALAAGCVLGWSSPAQSEVVKDSAYGFPVSEEQFSWIGSLATLGGVVSCLIIGVVMDFIGRKRTMLLLIVPFTCGWAMLIWASSVVVLYVGRFLLGFSGGAFFVVAPTYIGEIASKEIRGTLASYLQLMITVGILFIYAVGHLFTMQTYNIICGVLPLIFGAIFMWMPESPYYLMIDNQGESAANSMKWLRGPDYNCENELNEIRMEQETIQQSRVSLLNALQKPSTKRGLMISLCLVVFVQFAGINAVIFYTANIFDMAKVDGSSSTIIVGVMQVAGTFVSSLVVDKLGRRFLLITSASVMCICNICLGLYFVLRDQNSPLTPYLQWLPICAVCIYIVAFSLGLGPIPWVLVGELFSTETKAIASSLTGSTSWLIAFIVTKFFSNVSDAIGSGETFFIFAVFAAVCTAFVWFVVPETKGKSFSEIQRSLNVEAEAEDANNDSFATNSTLNTIVI